jgi:hypothetical protein
LWSRGQDVRKGTRDLWAMPRQVLKFLKTNEDWLNFGTIVSKGLLEENLLALIGLVVMFKRIIMGINCCRNKWSAD